MKFKNDPLWQKIASQPLGPEVAILGFNRRLARENGWTLAQAERVAHEYRRFLFLAARAGHPVTPSDAVDQAWHLHLVHTDDYWNVWCSAVLGFPFHHGPTRGGGSERLKFTDWYLRTLQSYHEWFGEAPPSDIWPPVEERFLDAAAFRRVNTRQVWLVPRPSIGVLARTCGLVAAAVTVTGCGVLGAIELNVFDWTGGPFLGLYTFLMLATGLVLVGTRTFRGGRPDDAGRPLEGEDPYVVAGMVDGSRGVLQAGLAALAARGLVDSHTATPNWVGRRKGVEAGPLSRVEEAIWAALPEKGEVEVRTLRKQLRPVLVEIRREVADRGWEPSAAKRRFRIAWRCLMVLALAAFGGVKILVGLSRDRPVGFLVVLVLVTILVGLIAAVRIARRTRAGETMLARCRTESAGLKASLRREGLDPDWRVPMMIALFGGSALAGTELATWERMFQRPLQRPGSNSSADSDGGWSSAWSDTGSSSILDGGGGGGGGSDGGGDSGCGGCGGCGGGGD